MIKKVNFTNELQPEVSEEMKSLTLSKQQKKVIILFGIEKNLR
jgi:hypothetical protein